MQLIITGSEGNIGRRLRAAYPGSIGIDVAAGAEIAADLAGIDYDAPDIRAAFERADGVIHLATSARPQDAGAIHYQAVTNTARLVAACAGFGIKRLVLASSDWAEPKTLMAKINTYGYSKRVFEAMAAMYSHSTGHAVALRFGWVPHDPPGPDTPQWLLDNYWDDARLLAEVRAALG